MTPPSEQMGDVDDFSCILTSTNRTIKFNNQKDDNVTIYLFSLL